MRQDPGPLPFLEEALTIATLEPGIYEIVRDFLACWLNIASFAIIDFSDHIA